MEQDGQQTEQSTNSSAANPILQMSPPVTQTLEPQQQQQQRRQLQKKSKPSKRNSKAKISDFKKPATPPPLEDDNVGEFIEEEEDVLQDSGMGNSQGETIYEELDNPENYEDLSDFDEPHFY